MNGFENIVGNRSRPNPVIPAGFVAFEFVGKPPSAVEVSRGGPDRSRARLRDKEPVLRNCPMKGYPLLQGCERT